MKLLHATLADQGLLDTGRMTLFGSCIGRLQGPFPLAVKNLCVGMFIEFEKEDVGFEMNFTCQIEHGEESGVFPPVLKLTVPQWEETETLILGVPVNTGPHSLKESGQYTYTVLMNGEIGRAHV